MLFKSMRDLSKKINYTNLVNVCFLKNKKINVEDNAKI